MPEWMGLLVGVYRREEDIGKRESKREEVKVGEKCVRVDLSH